MCTCRRWLVSIEIFWGRKKISSCDAVQEAIISAGETGEKAKAAQHELPEAKAAHQELPESKEINM